LTFACPFPFRETGRKRAAMGTEELDRGAIRYHVCLLIHLPVIVSNFRLLCDDRPRNEIWQLGGEAPIRERRVPWRIKAIR
jgi:hypothetical protein